MLPVERVIKIVLAFVMWAGGAISSFQTIMMSLLNGASRAPSQYDAVQRLHSRIDRKMHTYAAHRRQTTNSAFRILHAKATQPHANMWRSMKVH